MDKMPFILLAIVLSISLFVGLAVAWSVTYSHEKLHARLYRDLGYNSTIEMHLFGDSYTYPCAINDSDFELLEITNSINDAVHYNTAAPLVIMCVLLTMIWGALWVKK